VKGNVEPNNNPGKGNMGPMDSHVENGKQKAMPPTIDG